MNALSCQERWAPRGIGRPQFMSSSSSSLPACVAASGREGRDRRRTTFILSFLSAALFLRGRLSSLLPIFIFLFWANSCDTSPPIHCPFAFLVSKETGEKVTNYSATKKGGIPFFFGFFLWKVFLSSPYIVKFSLNHAVSKDALSSTNFVLSVSIGRARQGCSSVTSFLFLAYLTAVDPRKWPLTPPSSSAAYSGSSSWSSYHSSSQSSATHSTYYSGYYRHAYPTARSENKDFLRAQIWDIIFNAFSKSKKEALKFHRNLWELLWFYLLGEMNFLLVDFPLCRAWWRPFWRESSFRTLAPGDSGEKGDGRLSSLPKLTKSCKREIWSNRIRQKHKLSYIF